MVRGAFRERLWQVREEEIIRVAASLLTSVGFQAMSMDQVADQVGISKATLYQHFESKADLAATVVTGQVQRLGDCLVEGPRNGESPSQFLAHVLRTIFVEKHTLGAPDITDVTTDHEFAARLLQRADFCQAIDRATELLRELVSRAQAAGEIDPALPSEIVVQAMFGLVHGPDYRRLITSGRFTVDQIADSLVRLFLSGVRPALSEGKALSPWA